MASSSADLTTLCLFDVDGTLTAARQVRELKRKALASLVYVSYSNFSRRYESGR